MHILIAPDSFKESLSAAKVAQAIQLGFQEAMPAATFDLCPLGDGGEGTLEALIAGLGLIEARHEVTGPFGQPVLASYAFGDDLAVFDVASITGLERIPSDKRQPLKISNQGVGELLLFLAQQGFKRLLIGVGGSSSHDGGIGMAAGLGYEFFDERGQSVPVLGENLATIQTISDRAVSPLLKELDITVISDVTNPLTGPEGAAHIFAPQKGLALADCQVVDQATAGFYGRFYPEILQLAGAGAGGGMAAGLVAFAGGQISSGIDTILDYLDFDRRVATADLVIVGEGRLDRQSLAGKAPIGVARRTPKTTPLIAICGSLADDLPTFPLENIQAAFPIIAGIESFETTLSKTADNLKRTATNIANLLKL